MFSSNPKIDRLMIAMSEFEGWAIPSEKTPSGGSRSYRNHNPGNLRASPFQAGTQNGFAIFKNDLLGFMAFYWDLLQKAKGNTSTDLGPESSLRDLIYTWAPPKDGNNSEKYLDHVVEKSGIRADEKLKDIFSG